MKENKERAVLSSVLLMFQISLFVFAADAVITKGVNIMKTLLPIAVLQMILLVLLFVVLLVQFFVAARVSKKRTVDDTLLTCFVCGFSVVLWALAVYQMGVFELLGTKEFIFLGLQLALLLAYAILHRVMRKEKWKLATSGIVVAEIGYALAISLVYRNELLPAATIVAMYVTMGALLLLYVWGEELYSNIVGGVLLVSQAIVSVVVFYRLNHSKQILGILEELVDNRSLSQLLSLVMLVLVILLAITLVLQLIRHFQVAGKLISVVFVCLIVSLFRIVNGIESEAEGSFGVDQGDATTKVDYSLYVLKSDRATSAKDVLNYTIGVHYEQNEEQVREAATILESQAGAKLNFVEYETLSELGNAFYNGQIPAAFLDRATAEDIDAEIEMIDEDWIFTELTKVIASVKVDFVVEQEEEPPVSSGGNVSENADLTIEPFVVYLSGIDVYGDITTKSRSDVNVLMTVNPMTKEIALVTTPRDAYLQIPGKTKEGGYNDKLTHAGNYGVAYSIATLEKLYGIHVDYYIRVNFTSMEDIVDLLGGVDVYSHYTFTARHGKYRFLQGMNHMNGSQALSFARERKTVTGGDVTRGKHHIELVKGLFQKVTSTAVLMNYQSLMSTVANNFQTDISTAQLAALASMQLRDNAQWHFTSYAAAGSYSNEYCNSYRGNRLSVCILTEESVYRAADLMARVLNGDRIADGEYDYEQ